MNNMHAVETVFLVLTIVQLLILATHDSVNMFPLNDVQNLRESMSLKERALMIFANTIFVVVLLALAIIFWGKPKPIWFTVYGLAYYAAFFVLVYQQWYKLYLFGAPDDVSAKYQLEYSRTLQILPIRGSNPRPNLLHVMLHMLFIVNAILVVMIGLNPVK